MTEYPADYITPHERRLRDSALLRKTILGSTRTSNIPTNRLHYRWHRNGPHHTNYGKEYITALKLMENAIRNDVEPNLNKQFEPNWESVKSMVESVEENGILDPLIVWEMHPETFLILRGNQRLTVARAKGIYVLHCVVLADWRDEKLYVEFK